MTIQSAQAEMNAVMRVIGREHQEDSKHGVLIRPLREWMVGEVRRPFLAVLGAVVFLLLIGCLNVEVCLGANDGETPGACDPRESWRRGRARLVRQMLVESLLLGLTGGTLGLSVALAIVKVTPRISVVPIPRLEEISIDTRLFAAAFLISVGGAILFSVAPGLGIARLNLRLEVNGGDESPGKTSGNGIRSGLVAAQIALALVLLSGAGLMANTFLRLLRIDLGFDRTALVTVNASLPYKQYSGERSVEFYRRLSDLLEQRPGVRAISVSDGRPSWRSISLTNWQRPTAPPGLNVKRRHGTSMPATSERLEFRSWLDVNSSGVTTTGTRLLSSSIRPPPACSLATWIPSADNCKATTPTVA